MTRADMSVPRSIAPLEMDWRSKVNSSITNYILRTSLEGKREGERARRWLRSELWALLQPLGGVGGGRAGEGGG